MAGARDLQVDACARAGGPRSCLSGELDIAATGQVSYVVERLCAPATGVRQIVDGEAVARVVS
jgi:hypothetical protein